MRVKQDGRLIDLRNQPDQTLNPGFQVEKLRFKQTESIAVSHSDDQSLV